MIIDRISVGRYGGSLDDMMGDAGKLLAIGPGSVLQTDRHLHFQTWVQVQCQTQGWEHCDMESRVGS